MSADNGATGDSTAKLKIRLLVVLFSFGTIAIAMGAVVAAATDYAAWREITWFGLVVCLLGAVCGWWWEPPKPLAVPGSEGTRPTNPNASSTATSAAAAPQAHPATTTVAGGYWLTRVLANRLEPCFAWLFAYPLFPLQIGLFWAITWADFAGGIGVPALVWGDQSWTRIWVGISVSLLFSNVLFIRALLDRRPGSVPPDFGERASLFWFAEPGSGVRQVGAFLTRMWLPALAIFYLPGIRKDWIATGHTLPGTMLLGLVSGVVVTVLIVAIYDRWFSARWQNTKFFKSLPAFRGPHPLVAEKDQPLHGLATILTAIPVVFVGVLFIESRAFHAIWSPVWLFCLLLGLFNSIYGFVTFHLAGLQYVLLLMAGAIVFVSNTAHPYKMSHPGLEDYADARVDLDGPPPAPDTPLDLIETEELLKRFQKNWAEQHATSGLPAEKRKPKMVLVATTGGGIQASVWTAVVLEHLESAMPGDSKEKTAFRDHIRLITGASGGTLAAGLYVADFENAIKDRPLSAQLAEDSLWSTFQTMLVHDLPTLAWPRSLALDRGRSLERQWELNCAPWTKNGQPSGPPSSWITGKMENYQHGESAFAKKFYSLRDDELACKRPTLILAPMMVEDCRRLLISNLSMDWFTATHVRNSNPAAWYQPASDPDLTSIPAIELWRYFPKSRDKFKVGTAARMAATFPFVGPAVSLPSNPPRRIVDAGYFDNFGINLASLWLFRHRELIEKYTDGVVVVEIRAYPRRAEKLRFDTRKPVPGEKLPPETFDWAVAEAGTPLTALYNLYSRGAYFRNEQFLDTLDREFNGEHKNRKPGKPFFTTVTFECEQPAALNWTLPKHDYDKLLATFSGPTPRGVSDELKAKLAESRQQNQATLQKLTDWFGAGGTR